jgi:hypothetical protein
MTLISLNVIHQDLSNNTKGTSSESMVKYIEKIDEKISHLKRDNFSQKHKKVYPNF